MDLESEEENEQQPAVANTPVADIDNEDCEEEEEDDDDDNDEDDEEFEAKKVKLHRKDKANKKGKEQTTEKGKEEENVAACADVQVELAYCVELAGRGATWKAAWCPCAATSTSSSSSFSSSSSSSSTDDSSIGRLAVVNGDGSCLILQLPSVNNVKFSGNSSSNSSSSVSAQKIVPVLQLQSLLVIEVAIPDLMAHCVDWNPLIPTQFCCGMSDGSVTMWDLRECTPNKTCGPVNARNTAREAVVATTPFIHLVDLQHTDPGTPSFSAVRTVQYCPYEPQLILAAGHDDFRVSIFIWV